jgi:hypothetical protein
MLITRDTKATERILTARGVMLGLDWLKSECERIKARDSWRDPKIVKVRKGYAIKDDSIKKIMTKNRVPKVVPSNAKRESKISYWTQEEDDVLISMYQAGANMYDIAKKVGRGYSSCYKRVETLGIEKRAYTRA